MSGLRLSSMNRDLATLWTAGRLGSAEDMQLIGLFLERDSLSDTAFRVLVERHGAMVMGVCQRVLGDCHDAQDAAQAVFLVLARKAGTISRGSVAAWLYGVSLRVAGKARKRLGIRRDAETRTLAALAKGEAVASSSTVELDSDVILEAVASLAEKYRTPIVLCYLEGLTYEEAAQRVGCPVGTIRIRLSRARDRLRERLVKKGFGPASATPVTADVLEAILAPPSASVPAGWVDATSRSAQAFLAGPSAAAAAVSASTLILTQGVLRSMMLTKLKYVACGILGVGLLTTGGSVIVGQDKGKPSEPAAVAAAGAAQDPTPGDLAKQELAKATEISRRERLVEQRRLVEKIRSRALERLDGQKAFYEEGKITIDRFLAAIQDLRDAETLFAENPEQTQAAFKKYQAMLSEVVKREKSELEVGRGTIADISEAEAALERANYDLHEVTESQGKGHELSLIRLERRISAIEMKQDEILRAIKKKEGDSNR